jgi:hypothetical protein
MGGGIYSQDVAANARSTQADAFSYSAYRVADGSGAERRAVHPALSPFGKKREVNNATPIVVALDVTRSRGDDTKLMYAKLPMLMGQILLHQYVENPGLSFASVGDATVDEAPLQVSQFEADNRLDEALARMWIEEGGGGSGQESYELCAYFYSRTNTVRLNKGIGKKGYFFFVGDEGFYPKVDRGQVKRLIGDDLPEDLDSAEAFRRLSQKFHVFFLYPGKPLAERKADIDAEIRQRVTAAGGLYDNVDVRASLLWNNRNDLDLHVVPPSGEEVFYAHKKSACGGWLDVDMNVRGETEKPVENIRWARGQAPAGRYKVYVQNYAFHEKLSPGRAPSTERSPTPFRVELEVAGTIQHFEGVASPKGETGHASNVLVHEFTFDPTRARRDAIAEAPDPYAAYADEVVLKQWRGVIPPEHVLRVGDPKAIVDVLLGALAIADGGRTLETFLADLVARDATEARIEQVRTTLASLTSLRSAARVTGVVPGGTARAGRTVRL